MEDESIPTTSKSEIEGLIRQLSATSLDLAAKDKIKRLLRTILSLALLLKKKNTSITKLKKLIFGKKSERHGLSKKSPSDKTRLTVVKPRRRKRLEQKRRHFSRSQRQV
jgi:hypothetical protein